HIQVQCILVFLIFFFFFFSRRRRHTSSKRDWSSDVCSSDLSRARLYRSSIDASSTNRSHGPARAVERVPADAVPGLFAPHRTAPHPRHLLVPGSGAQYAEDIGLVITEQA